MNKSNGIYSLLANKFPSNEFALLWEVRDNAGFRASRSADGIALNLWPSRGLELHGIEIKSYRNDWINELKNPAKADVIYKFCDRWWVVADKEGIIKEEEVPKTWGLLVAKNDKIYTKVEAPKLEPIPLDRGFIVAMLKRATNSMIHRDSIAEEIREAREIGRTSRNKEIERLYSEKKHLEEAISEFEEKSGILLLDWNAGRIGEAVKFITNGGIDKIRKELLELKEQSDSIQQALTEILTI